MKSVQALGKDNIFNLKLVYTCSYLPSINSNEAPLWQNMSFQHTHIVLAQVRMVPLYPIVQDGHNHAFTCVAQLPRSFGIQVTVVGVVLRARGQQIAQRESNYPAYLSYDRRTRKCF